MRLFSTRCLRPDRPPEVRPLDLAAIAAGRGRVNRRVTRGRDAPLETLVASLASVTGRGVCVLGDAPAATRREADVVAVLTLDSRRISVEFDRRTRIAWLGIVLGSPVDSESESRLPDGPSPLERRLLEGTLLDLLVPGIASADGAPEDRRWQWTSAPTVRVGRTARRLRLQAATTWGPVELQFAISEEKTAPDGDPGLDRSLRRAEVSLTVRLDPAAAGLSLRAGDLARFEPGDVLVTDLPAGDGSLPAELGGSPARAGIADSSQFRGRIGLAGGRRAVRLERWSAGNASDR